MDPKQQSSWKGEAKGSSREVVPLMTAALGKSVVFGFSLKKVILVQGLAVGILQHHKTFGLETRIIDLLAT